MADIMTSKAVDGILNYDLSDDDDPFADVAAAKPTRDDKQDVSSQAPKRKADDDEREDYGLGLEEVKVKKQRKPVAKLDEARLLTQSGIPKLRALARSGQISRKLRLKGKGHEFTDVARLLNYYQLWLDNLYPRAKFADGLQLIEKVGHSRRLQVMRKEWIDEGKPGHIKHSALQTDAADAAIDIFGAQGTGHNKVTKVSGADEGDDGDMFFPDSIKASRPEEEIFLPDDDDLEALLADEKTSEKLLPSRTPQVADNFDDLDALMAEQDSRSEQTYSKPVPKPDPKLAPDEEEDDLDALLAEQDSRQVRQPSQPQSVFNRPSLEPTNSAVRRQKPKRTPFDDSDDEDHKDDDLDALLAEHDSYRWKPVGELPKDISASGNEKSQPEVTVQQEFMNHSVEEVAIRPPRSNEKEGADRDELNADAFFSSSPIMNE